MSRPDHEFADAHEARNEGRLCYGPVMELAVATIEAHWSDPSTAAFRHALEALAQLAEQGDAEAAEYLGDIHAMNDAAHDAERSYRWYFVAALLRRRHAGDDDACGHVQAALQKDMTVRKLVRELGPARSAEIDAEVTGTWPGVRRRP